MNSPPFGAATAPAAASESNLTSCMSSSSRSRGPLLITASFGSNPASESYPSCSSCCSEILCDCAGGDAGKLKVYQARS